MLLRRPKRRCDGLFAEVGVTQLASLRLKVLGHTEFQLAAFHAFDCMLESLYLEFGALALVPAIWYAIRAANCGLDMDFQRAQSPKGARIWWKTSCKWLGEC